MSRIPDRSLNSVVYLYLSEAEAKDGSDIGGSGFLIGLPVASDGHLLCVVTNKHVVDNGATIVRINKQAGGFSVIPLDDTWFFHPGGADLAVCPIGLSGEHRQISFLTPENWIDRDFMKDFDIGPGDEAYVVGRFVTKDGRQKNTPTARFGNIAQMPDEPISVDGIDREAFLVEIRSIAGYSGSPVFVTVAKYTEWPGTKKLDKHSGVRVTAGELLLGINFINISYKRRVIDERTEKPVNEDWYVEDNSGMMGVVPAWCLVDIIEGEEMKPFIDSVKNEFKSSTA